MTVEESEFNEGFISYKDDGASGGNPSLSLSKDLLLTTTQYLTYFCPPYYCPPSPLRHTFFLSLWPFPVKWLYAKRFSLQNLCTNTSHFYFWYVTGFANYDILWLNYHLHMLLTFSGALFHYVFTLHNIDF